MYYQISDESIKILKSNIKKVKEQKELYIIRNNVTKEVFIVNTGLEVLDILGINELLNNNEIKKISSNKLELIYHFASTFIAESNKFKSYTKFTVYKYNKITRMNRNKIHKVLPDYLKTFNELLKTKEVQKYFRNHKLNRICSD